MKYRKTIAALAGAAVLSLALVGCGGSSSGSAEPQGGSDEPVAAVEQLTSTSGAIVHLDEANTQAEVEVTVAEGEALVTLAHFDSLEGEATAVLTQDGMEISTDYFYEGDSFSQMEVDPGTYSVAIDGVGGTGTVYVMAYPADAIDVTSMELEDIIAQVTSEVA